MAIDTRPEIPTTPVEHPPPAERAAQGKAARLATPRSSHGDWEPSADRDPLGILAAQEQTRVPELIPIRNGRMAASPFAFYRGAAAVMAADLGPTPRTHLDVQLCGDAHLMNFGGFASPERSLVFDVNDFDETLPGPFEWDVKRLAASLEVAARERGFDTKVCTRIVTSAVASYREGMREYAAMNNLDLWYTQLDIVKVAQAYSADISRKAMKNMNRNVEKAESKDRLKAAAKLTRLVDGVPEFVSNPPLLVPVRDLFSEARTAEFQDSIRGALRSYRRTLTNERRHLLETYGYIDIARKVVGVGSVGTRCYVVLLLGRDNGDPLLIQVKEAEASVLEPYLHKSTYANHGHRVVAGQKLTQAASDIFLGWERITGIDGQERDFYMRQLWDWKASADVDGMDAPTLEIYGRICGRTLARGHARSGDRIAIAAYLGSSTTFDDALARFAAAYADQNDRDHTELTEAIKDGRVDAEPGV
jgi:uncharacterized protein (DUF2252 family)